MNLDKANALKVKAPGNWDAALGKIKVKQLEVIPDRGLWVMLDEKEGFPVDPDGYYFVNPPTKHNGVLDEAGAFMQIVGDAAAFYAANPSNQTTTTVFGDATDGRVYSTATTTYANARSGSSGLAASVSEGFINLGQTLSVGDYICQQGFFAFDTSSIPDTDNVTDVVFSLWNINDPTNDFILEARVNNWGAAVTTADWIAGASLSALTLLASGDTSGLPTDDTAYWALTSTGAFVSNIVKTGLTYFMCCSDDQTLGNAPTGTDRMIPLLSEEAGTTKDPKLVVTHSAAGGAVSLDPFGMSGFFGS